MSAAAHVVGRLSAFIDGDLPEREAVAVRWHLDGCPGCRAEADAMRAMIDGARDLGRERPEPPATLWPAIEGELRRGEGLLGRWRPFLFGAVAGAAAMLAVTFAPWREGAARGPAAIPLPAARPAADPLIADAEVEFERAARQYEASIEKLRGLLAGEQAGWSIEARARLSERLGRLDDAITRSRAAARRAPGDLAGNEILFAAYRKKIDYLTDAVHRGGPGDEETSWR